MTDGSILHIYGLLGKHLKALNDEVGGGFEAAWYDRVYEQVGVDLQRFMSK